MSLSHSPSISTNGLVFCYDQANIKSYRGPAVQNLANNISIHGTGTTTGYSSAGTTEIVNIPEVGQITSYRNTIQNNYTSYTPNSTICCPSLHYWGGITVSPSTLYTYLILYKCDSGYTNPNYMYRYEYTSNGGSYVTEGGVHSEANRVHLGSNWYYAWGTFTTQATTSWLDHCGTFYYRYSNVSDNLSVAKVAIIQGNYSGMHPKYWPNTATTRTSTQSIFDLTNNNIDLTVSNLSYSSNGTFSFNNSSSVITIPNHSSLNPTNALSIEAWVKFNGDSDDFIFEKGNVNTQYSLFSHSTDIVFRTYHSGDGTYHTQSPAKSTVGVVNGQPVHIVGSWDGSTKRIYINGVLKDSVSKTGNLVITSAGAAIGRFGGTSTGYYFGGDIYKVSVYNRGLTGAEILQNFAAHRGRYGL